MMAKLLSERDLYRIAATPEHLPALILTDKLPTSASGTVFASVTELITQSDVNHSMLLLPEGLATQEKTYHVVGLERYLDGHHRIEVYRLRLDRFELGAILADARRDLADHWWRKLYDWLGIMGQALHISWLQNPLKYYCSERCAKHLRRAATIAALGLPTQPDPGDLKRWALDHPYTVECAGIYDPRLEESSADGADPPSSLTGLRRTRG